MGHTLIYLAQKKPRRHRRLDYFLISDTLLDLVNKCPIKSGYRSDHSILELVLTFCKFQRGRGLWKFNSSLLKHKDYLIAIHSVIEKEKLNYALPVYHPIFISKLDDSTNNFTISDRAFLELLLPQIRGETIKYALNLKRQSFEKEQNLKNAIKNMEKNLGQIDQYKLDQKLDKKIKGVMIQSRAQWLNDEEKTSKYLSSLEKKTTSTLKKQSEKLSLNLGLS